MSALSPTYYIQRGLCNDDKLCWKSTIHLPFKVKGFPGWANILIKISLKKRLPKLDKGTYVDVELIYIDTIITALY